MFALSALQLVFIAAQGGTAACCMFGQTGSGKTHTMSAVLENAGRIALRRGPLLYCAEAADHPNTDVRELTLPDDEEIRPSWRPDLLGGVTVLNADALAPGPDPAWDRWLYRGLAETEARKTVLKHRILVAIPYFVGANREPGAMQVWLRRA